MRVLARGRGGISTKAFDGQYFPIRLGQDRLLSSLFNGTKQNNNKKIK